MKENKYKNEIKVAVEKLYNLLLNKNKVITKNVLAIKGIIHNTHN